MYAKLFSRITESSLMEEAMDVRYTFMMLLAISDPTGHVIGTDIAIARRLNMPLGQFKTCLAELNKPDPASNSKEHEGRRIIESEGERGYFVVNYLAYRALTTEDDRREYMREYMRKRRAAERLTSSVNNCKHPLAMLGQAEAEAETEAKTKKKARSGAPTQDQWLAEIRELDCYRPLNIDKEIGKAHAWCLARRRRCTQRFFVNWLNRALDDEKTVELPSTPTGEAKTYWAPSRI